MNVLDVIEIDQPNDIFVLKQIKPINNLSVEQHLLIEHEVLHSAKSKNVPSVGGSRKKIVAKNSKKSSKKNSEKKINLKKSAAKTKQNNLKQNHKNSLKFSSNTILNYLIPVNNETDHSHLIVKKNNEKFYEENPYNQKIIGAKECDPTMTIGFCTENEVDLIYQESCQSSLKSANLVKKDVHLGMQESNHKPESVQLSPGIAKKKKKFNLSGELNPKVSPSKQVSSAKKSIKISDFKNLNYLTYKNTLEQTSSKSTIEPKQESFIANLASKDYDEKNFEDNGDLLCFLLKNIISEILRQQEDQQIKCAEYGGITEKLITDNDCDILEQFCKLEIVYCKVYVRVLCRSKQWYRLSTLSFKDVCEDLKNIFEKLHEKNLIDVNIEQADLKTQMELLSKAEIQELCKLFKMPIKSWNASKKLELIDKLIESSQCQRSVKNMFTQNKSSLIDLLQLETTKCLGTCVSLNETAKATFNKILLLFSFPHYFDEEEKRFRDQLYMCMNVHKKFIKFPNYTLSPTVVFETLEDFELFSEALKLQESFYAAVTAKKYDEFFSVSEKVKKGFKKLLRNEKYTVRYMRLEPFLKRFSAGHIYAKLLTKFCSKFKTKTSVQKIIKTAQMLLAQNLFLSSKRGKWYEILSQALEGTKDSKAAAEILIQAHSDPYLDEVQKLTLQLRGQALLKKKSNGIEEASLREILSDFCSVSVQEPSSIEIVGKAMQGNKSGFKSVYIEDTNDGKMYTSVEERALLHYKAIGFTKGYHVEGYIIQSLYAFLFFDIIYQLSPPGVFQSSYQETPLDFFTEHFYLNRKTSLELRLKEMLQWTEEEAANKIKSVYYDNFNTSCIISWKEYFTPEIFCEIMKCITLPVLANIFSRLVKNFRVAQAGFPDLTLWNPETQQCKFVEVKSPNDKLSPAQRVWLDFLRKAGIDCEVCNVKNISRKLLL